MSCKRIGESYGLDGDLYQRQYRDHLSGYRQWDQLAHATDWVLFEKNMGSYIGIDEVGLSKGELYTIVINKAAKGRRGSIIAIVRGQMPRESVKSCLKCLVAVAFKRVKSHRIWLLTCR